jgi:hypothetical protein
MSVPMTPYLAMVLVGYAAFMCAIAYASITSISGKK